MSMLEEIAVIDTDGTHPRSAFDATVAAICDGLVRAGARDNVVAIRGSHGHTTLAAIAACLATARRIVFIDPATDLLAVGSILRALGVAHVVDSSGSLSATSPFATLDVRNLGRGDASVSGRRCEEYAILTTGTTGEPKAIVQTIENLQAHIRNYVGYAGIGARNRVLQLASAGWDAGLMDLFACLWHGAVLCSINPRQHDVAAVRAFIREHAIDVLHMTVPYFRLVYADSTFTHTRPFTLVLGGELIARRDLERFDRIAPRGSVAFNAYGPTECTTALYNRHAVGDAVIGETFALAYGVPDVAVAIARDGVRIDEAHRTGELLIASPLIARRLELSSRTAVAIDTTLVDGQQYYATGDLAHRDERGQIVITGRKDTVIKVNGQKVSLHEIEAVMRGLEEVSDVCVLARPGEVDATVIAAVVPTRAEIDASHLRRVLATKLAPHKLPKQVLVVATLPLNQNNKIDRARILALAAAETSVTASADSPLLAEVEKALNSKVDASLSFVENGGDSLRALAIVAALKRRGFRLSLKDLVSSTPLAQLRYDTVAPRSTVPHASDADAWLPNRAFLESRGIPDLDRWCQTVVFDHAGSRPPAELAAALEAVLARHAASFGGALPSVDVMSTSDLRGVISSVEQRISLAAGRTCLAAIVVDDAGAHALISTHQFHIDRASWLVLLAELSDATREGPDAVRSWPAPSMSYREWASLYRRARSGDRASALWEGMPWTRARDLVAPSAAFPSRDAFARSSLDLGDVASARTPQLHLALLTASLVGLAESLEHSVQKVDILRHGRDLMIDGREAHGIVGWFTIIHPVVIEVGATARGTIHSVADLLRRLEGLTHTFANEHHGTSAMRCDVSFNFLGNLELAATEEWVVNPVSIETMHGAASHRLELTGQISRGRLHLVIDRDPAVLNEAQHARLCDAIRRAFDGLREEWS